MLRDRRTWEYKKQLACRARLRQLDERALINALLDCLGEPKPRRFKPRAKQRREALALYNARRLKENVHGIQD